MESQAENKPEWGCASEFLPMPSLEDGTTVHIRRRSADSLSALVRYSDHA
jgi:hypothetical protein